MNLSKQICQITGNLLYRFISAKSLAISVCIYQPLKGHAVKNKPPTSNAIDETPGTQYHLSLRSLNQSNLIFKYK
jgi:hypothetical protein